MDAFFVDQLTGQRFFALNLDPPGELFIKIAFTEITEWLVSLILKSIKIKSMKIMKF
jgi:hypothetical protein